MKKGTLVTLAILVGLAIVITLVIFQPPLGEWFGNGQAMQQAGGQFEPTGQQWSLFLGAIALLAVAVSIAAAVYAWLGLADPSQALGLPIGSVRAIIAIMLILLFAMMSQFLFEDVGAITVTDEIRMTQAQLERVPVERIYSAALQTDGSFLVVLRLENPTRDDLARQILTTLSTLVVSLAAFYFGSRAVSVAQGRDLDEAIVLTADPASLALANGASKTLKVESTAVGVKLSVRSDMPGVAEVKELAFGSYRVDAKSPGTAMVTVVVDTAPDRNVTVPVTVT